LRELQGVRHELQVRNRLLLIGVTCLAALAIMTAWAFLGFKLPGR